MKLTNLSIEGLHNAHYQKNYQFKNINYIVGPNGAGKSTILQAIQFGIFGYFPGTNKRSGDILTHSNSGTIDVLMEFSLEDNTTTELNRHLDSRKKEGNSTFTLGPVSEGFTIDTILGNVENVVFNFSEFLSMSANKQKEMLISILPSFSDSIKTEKYLKKANNYSPYCKDLVETYSKKFKELKNIEDIKALNSLIVEDKKEVANEDKRLVATAQSLIYYDDIDTSKSVETLKVELQDLNARKADLIVFNTNKTRAESITNEINQLQEYLNTSETFETLNETIKTLSKELEAANEEYSKLAESVQSKFITARQYETILNQNSICPVLECECDKLKDESTTLSAKVDELKASIDIDKAQISSIEKHKVELDNKLYELHNQIQTIEYSKNKLENLIEEQEGLFSTTFEPLSLEELDEQISIITDEIAKAGANENYEVMMDKVQERKAELKMQLDFLKEADKLTGENGLQTEMMVAPFENLAHEMKNLYTGLCIVDAVPKFVTTTQAHSFKFGLEREQFIPFNLLSSGEKCLFTIIFLTALSRISTAAWNVVMVDDLLDHLDDVKFKTVINNISRLDSDIQYIFAGVKMVDVDSSSEVNIIEVGD